MARNGSGGRPTSTPPTPPKQSSAPAKSRNWPAIVIAGLIVLGLLAGFLGAIVGASTSF